MRLPNMLTDYDVKIKLIFVMNIYDQDCWKLDFNIGHSVYEAVTNEPSGFSFSIEMERSSQRATEAYEKC